MNFNDGDLVVNDGETFENGIYYPGQPEERVAEERDKAAPVAASYPVMPEIAKWFNDQIKESENINNIQTQTMTVNGVKYSRTVSVEAQVLAYQMLNQLLTEKAREFEKYVEDES